MKVPSDKFPTSDSSETPQEGQLPPIETSGKIQGRAFMPLDGSNTANVKGTHNTQNIAVLSFSSQKTIPYQDSKANIEKKASHVVIQNIYPKSNRSNFLEYTRTSFIPANQIRFNNQSLNTLSLTILSELLRNLNENNFQNIGIITGEEDRHFFSQEDANHFTAENPGFKGQIYIVSDEFKSELIELLKTSIEKHIFLIIQQNPEKKEDERKEQPTGPVLMEPRSHYIPEKEEIPKTPFAHEEGKLLQRSATSQVRLAEKFLEEKIGREKEEQKIEKQKHIVQQEIERDIQKEEIKKEEIKKEGIKQTEKKRAVDAHNVQQAERGFPPAPPSKVLKDNEKPSQ